jgi:DNA-binding transcriptional MerR regulator
MQIGELAARSGLSHDTLRYYERQGLIAAQRGGNGYRRYAPETPGRLALIRLAQGLGFSLAEIREVLSLLQTAGGELPTAQVQALLQARLARMDQRLAELQRLREQVRQQLEAACPLRLASAGPTH